MNRASKMGGSLSRKMLLRKKVDYQEECLLRKIVVLERTDDLKQLKSLVATCYRQSFISLKTRLFRKENWSTWTVFLRKSKKRYFGREGLGSRPGFLEMNGKSYGQCWFKR